MRNIGHLFIRQSGASRVLQGLLLAKEKGFRKVVDYADSTIVVGVLNGTMVCNARHYAVIQRCKDLLQDGNWEVKVFHCYREGNQVADTLVNLGIGLCCDFVYFNEPPREVAASLYADQLGIKFLRFIIN